MLRAQCGVRARELSKAVVEARGRGYGASVRVDGDAVYLVVEPVGSAHDHSRTAEQLNAMHLGHSALTAIREACADCPRDVACVVELARMGGERASEFT